jgi:general secretion pathway protein G
VEFAIALLVAALIFGTMTPVYLHIIEKKKIDLAAEEISRYQRDIDRFNRKHTRYPADLAEVYPHPPMDPWGQPYKYLNIKNGQPGNPRTGNNLARLNADYDLYSDGPDGLSLSPIGAGESRDDIIRAKNGAYTGVAADFR